MVLLMYCQKCGSQFRPGTEVCFNCGAELIEEPETVVTPTTEKPASKNLLIAGWIFSVLGGLIGVIISSHIAFAKIKTPNGYFSYKYDLESRRKGRTMLIVCVSVMILGLIIQLAFGA